MIGQHLGGLGGRDPTALAQCGLAPGAPLLVDLEEEDGHHEAGALPLVFVAADRSADRPSFDARLLPGLPARRLFERFAAFDPALGNAPPPRSPADEADLGAPGAAEKRNRRRLLNRRERREWAAAGGPRMIRCGIGAAFAVAPACAGAAFRAPRDDAADQAHADSGPADHPADAAEHIE